MLLLVCAPGEFLLVRELCLATRNKRLDSIWICDVRQTFRWDFDVEQLGKTCETGTGGTVCISTEKVNVSTLAIF